MLFISKNNIRLYYSLLEVVKHIVKIHSARIIKLSTTSRFGYSSYMNMVIRHVSQTYNKYLY